LIRSTPHPLDRYGVTVKLVVLVAVPPGVVIMIFPVFAPVGTVAVTCVSESTVKLVAATAPNVTFVLPVRLTPVITTGIPTAPLLGLNVLIDGITRNFWLLFNVPAEVTTVTNPVVAPAGTFAVM
jgi:hypothetical protein